MIISGYQGISESRVTITKIKPGESFKDVFDDSIYQLISTKHDGKSYVVKVKDYANGEITNLYYEGNDEFIIVANPPEMSATRITQKKNLELFCKYTKLNLNPVYDSDNYQVVGRASYKAVTAKIKSYNKKFNQHVVATYDSVKDSILIRL